MRRYFDTEENLLSASQRLAQAVYPEAEVALMGYLKWMYLDNPDGHAILHADSDEEGLAAQFVLMPRSFIVSGGQERGAFSVNTITRSDRRGEGLFKKLATEADIEAKRSAVSFTVGFPNRDSIGGFTGTLGYRTIGTLPFLVKPLHWSPIVSGLIRRSKVRKGGDTSFSLSVASVFRGDKWVVSVCDVSDERLTDLLDIVNAKRVLAGIRTSEYLKWRYLDCPTRRYTILSVTDAEEREFRAYAVVRGLELLGWKCGAVVDLGCRSNDESIDALRFLLHVAMQKFQQESYALSIAACNTDNDEFEALRRAGFLAVPRFLLPQPLHFILKTDSSNVHSSLMQDFRKWFLTFGDYDVV